MTNHIFFQTLRKISFVRKLAKLTSHKAARIMNLFISVIILSVLFLSNGGFAAEKKTAVFKSIESDDEISKKPESEDVVLAHAKQTSDDKSNNDLQVQGVVRQIRGSPETDVFIHGVSERIIIPGNSKHNEIMNECLNSMKTGKSLSFTVDPISRQIRTWKNSPKNSDSATSK